ncbi:hypothetical protein DUI87_06708 [Hirundo rustica rustica]|uniref:C-type lectin domain-containing protein n=1 Tax=Hirundo rustica rustica TaxID=333673 RepID=A0A3M0KUL6_HIRRU|nr:hypothetical protein DUI87_06708 [Hirundo rustica rustica]
MLASDGSLRSMDLNSSAGRDQRGIASSFSIALPFSKEPVFTSQTLLPSNKWLCGDEHLCFIFDNNGIWDGYDCKTKPSILSHSHGVF